MVEKMPQKKRAKKVEEVLKEKKLCMRYQNETEGGIGARVQLWFTFCVLTGLYLLSTNLVSLIDNKK